VREERVRRLETSATERQTALENRDLARSLSKQMQNWQLIGQANDRTAQQLTVLAQNLTGLASEIGTGSEGIVAAAEEISGRAMTFVDQVSAIGQISDQIAVASHKLAATAGPTGIASEEAQHAVTQATEAVESLTQRAQAISDLAMAVKRVADQTNLLAFNANVEAIQAGDRGQRFAVVANEVRLVAERAIQLAREIGELSDEVQGGTQRALYAISQIAMMVDQTVSLVQVTSQTSQSQEISAEVMAQSVKTLRSVFQQNAEDIQTVADTVQQQRRGLQRIAELGQELVESASGLSSLAETLGG
jgi:methyl-accepting chemotaxis protein